MSTTDPSNAGAANATTSKTPDQIRTEIDATRDDLGSNVDALADKVNPTQIAHRQADKVKSRFTGIKESVMGTHEQRSSGSSRVDSAKDTAHQAAEKAKGNPLAVGLIAFGAGWLVSSLMPTSEKEQDLAEQVKDRTAPLVSEAKNAAQDLAQNLKEPAQDAFESVKNTAQDAAGSVREEAQGAAGEVKSSAQDSKDTVQNS